MVTDDHAKTIQAGDVGPCATREKASTQAHSQPVRSRAILFALKFALSLGSVAFLLLLLEGAVRLFTDIPAPLFENDPLLGNRYRRNFAGAAFMEESGEVVQFRTNREGLRDRDRPLDKPAGVRRVAVLGDSMISAMATVEKNTAVRILEQLLRESQPAVEWDVMNCGVSGFSTGAELVMYREVARKYDPDIVLCCFCAHNDLGDNSPELSGNPHRVYFEPAADGTLKQLPLSEHRASLSAWLNRHSRFYVWQKHATSVLIGKSKESLGILPRGKLSFCARESPEVARAWEVTSRIIETLHREVTADGSQFAMVLLPSADQIYDETWQEDLQLAGELREDMDPNYVERKLREICTSAGAPLLTMTEEFRDAAPHRSVAHEEELLHYGGIGHFNDAGNRLAAEAMHRFLVEGQPQLAVAPFVTRFK